MTATKQPASDVSWYAWSAEDAAAQLGVDPDQGLATGTAQQRLTQYGPNELEWGPGQPSTTHASVAMTMAFAIIALSAVNIGLVMPRERQAPWASPVFPYLGWIILGWVITWAAVELQPLQRLLDTTSLSGGQWGVVIRLSLLAPAVAGIDKAIQLSRQRSRMSGTEA